MTLQNKTLVSPQLLDFEVEKQQDFSKHFPCASIAHCLITSIASSSLENTEVVRHLGSEVVRHWGFEVVRYLGSEVDRNFFEGLKLLDT